MSFGGVCSWLRMVTFLSMRLSVMCLPQSRGFDDGVLYLGVSDGDVVAYNGWSVRGDGSIVRAFMSQRSSRIFRMEWRS